MHNKLFKVTLLEACNLQQVIKIIVNSKTYNINKFTSFKIYLFNGKII